MDSNIEKRINELLEHGNVLIAKIPHNEDGSVWYWCCEDDNLHEYQAWIASVVNIVRIIAPPDTIFHSEFNRLLSNKDMQRGVPVQILHKIFGLLMSLKEEVERGLLKQAEYIFTASTFDDFLDHAADYHKADKKVESAVLASAVFEDTIRKIAVKNELKEPVAAVEQLINELVKAGVLTPVKSKRAKSYAAVRNSALHARWEDFDIKDVGQMIQGTRELIDEFL